jgi:uncharacterized membrane protein YqgA involved in biofilm formation
MKGLGTIIDSSAILAGGLFGLFIGSRMPEKIHTGVMNIIGLVSIFIGIQMGLTTKNILIVLGSLLIGVIIGEIVNIDEKLQRLGQTLEKRFSKGNSGQFTKAFVTSTLLSCVGPLAILGPIQEGLTGDIKLLATKSILDLFMSLAVSSAMGVGVFFTSVSVLIYQGSLTIFAQFVSQIMTEVVIAELTAVGGIMVLSSGLSILEIKKLKTTNMLPALLIAPLIIFIGKSMTG